MGNKISDNAIWTAIAQFGVIAIQMVTLLILSNFLDVKTFGAFAIALALVNFVNLFKDLGTSTTIIKKEDLRSQDIDSAHTLNFAGSMLAGLGIFSSSIIIDKIYKNPDLTLSIIIIAISVPFSSLGLAKLALLQRKSQFKLIAVIELAAALAASLLAILGAIFGIGIYALVVQLITSIIVLTVAYLKVPCEHQPKFSKNKNNFLNIFKHGSHITGFNFIHYVTRNGDVFLVGKIFGEYWLGLYVMGLRIAMITFQLITAIVNRAFLPILSNYQNSNILISKSYITINKIIINLACASTSILITFKSELVSKFLGEKWSDLEMVLIPLTCSGLIFSISGVSNIYLIIKNNSKLLMLIGFIQMIFTMLIVVFAGYFDFYFFLNEFLYLNIFIGLSLIISCCRELNINYKYYFLSVFPSLLRSIIFFMAVFYLKNLFEINYYSVKLIVVLLSLIITWFIVFKPFFNDYSTLKLDFNK